MTLIAPVAADVLTHMSQTRYLCRLAGMTLDPVCTFDAITTAVERGHAVTILSVWNETAPPVWDSWPPPITSAADADAQLQTAGSVMTAAQNEVQRALTACDSAEREFTRLTAARATFR